MEQGLEEEEELVRFDPPRPVQSGLGAVLATAAVAAGPGAPCTAPCPVMTLRPSALRLCLLLLLSGALCQPETGFETESPVQTLQVETLVRRLSRSAEVGRALCANTGRKEPAIPKKYGD